MLLCLLYLVLSLSLLTVINCRSTLRGLFHVKSGWTPLARDYPGNMRCILISIARLDPCQVTRGHSSLVAVHGLFHLGSWYWAILDLMLDLPPSLMKIFVDFPLVLLDHDLIIEVVRTNHQFFIEFKTALQLWFRVGEVEFGEFVNNLPLSLIAIQGWQFDALESRLGSRGRFRGRGKVYLPFGEV